MSFPALISMCSAAHAFLRTGEGMLAGSEMSYLYPAYDAVKRSCGILDIDISERPHAPHPFGSEGHAGEHILIRAGKTSPQQLRSSEQQASAVPVCDAPKACGSSLDIRRFAEPCVDARDQFERQEDRIWWKLSADRIPYFEDR